LCWQVAVLQQSPDVHTAPAFNAQFWQHVQDCEKVRKGGSGRIRGRFRGERRGRRGAEKRGRKQ
jgi:hypothetical protein